MPEKYISTKQLQNRLGETNDRKIRRWAEAAHDEGRPIVWEGIEYHPKKKHPRGAWEFLVVEVASIQAKA